MRLFVVNLKQLHRIAIGGDLPVRDCLGTLGNEQVVLLVFVVVILVIYSGEVVIVFKILHILDNEVEDGNGDSGAEHILAHVLVIFQCVEALDLDVGEGPLLALGQRRVLLP